MVLADSRSQADLLGLIRPNFRTPFGHTRKKRGTLGRCVTSDAWQNGGMPKNKRKHTPKDVLRLPDLVQ